MLIKRLLIFFSVLLAAMSSYADSKYVTVEGLKFLVDSITKQATLMPNDYSGDVTVPETFTDNDVTYEVTALGDGCFGNCIGLTSVSLPSTITWLENGCFGGCSSLKSVSLPSSITWLGNGCFSHCSSLTRITIPSTVTGLGISCFEGCSSLTSITIPSSVTSIGNRCFYDCWFLTSVDVSSSLTTLSAECFSNCVRLESITLPSSIISIGDQCFYNCNSLADITLPSSVKSLGGGCFAQCSMNPLPCLAQTPPAATDAFFDFNTANCVLYVPDVDAYRAAEGWKCFTYINNVPSANTCGKPVIAYSNGKLHFSDETEGAKYHCTITSPDVMSDVLNETGTMELSAYYDISVYATAAGYNPSDKATAKLYWVKDDGNLTTDNINSAKMRGVLVSTDGGIVRLSGLNDGELVQFYAIDGKLLGRQNAISGTASISTSEPIIVCKMGETRIKVRVE